MLGKEATLSVIDHDRDSAGMTYVYPVVSRRARGVSVGINLNVNNACNWRCVYCQVPDLRRGAPPPVDLERLRAELRAMLSDILQGDFMARHVPEDMRQLRDIALSGNGEPTSAPEFPEVIELIAQAMREFNLIGRIKLVLISNGSLAHKARVRQALSRMADLGGEIWFKLDRATAEGMRAVNGTAISPERVVRNLGYASQACPTWLQTCVFALDGQPPEEAEIEAYLDLLRRLRAAATPVRGILLYGLARPSMQPEGSRLGRLPEAWLETLASRIEALGFSCKTYA
jgi:wyosine [tRNA(Phe)-imidazoG37] synthetase (radical SAM superfamily)